MAVLPHDSLGVPPESHVEHLGGRGEEEKKGRGRRKGEENKNQRSRMAERKGGTTTLAQGGNDSLSAGADCHQTRMCAVIRPTTMRLEGLIRQCTRRWQAPTPRHSRVEAMGGGWRKNWSVSTSNAPKQSTRTRTPTCWLCLPVLGDVGMCHVLTILSSSKSSAARLVSNCNK